MLVRLCLGGSKEAFDELIRRYHSPIFGYTASKIKDQLQAEDVVQEVFLRAYTSLPRFKGPGFAGWLFKIAKHICQKWLRDTARRISRETKATLLHKTGSQDQPSEHSIDREAVQLLREAIVGLPDHWRMALFMKFDTGMSLREIAARLGKPEGTIKSWLSRAYQTLRRRLRELL
jgi:RNA polymerase sigma-70 factor (ECF subfamily)